MFWPKDKVHGWYAKVYDEDIPVYLTPLPSGGAFTPRVSTHVRKKYSALARLLPPHQAGAGSEGHGRSIRNASVLSRYRHPQHIFAVPGAAGQSEFDVEKGGRIKHDIASSILMAS